MEIVKISRRCSSSLFNDAGNTLSFTFLFHVSLFGDVPVTVVHRGLLKFSNNDNDNDDNVDDCDGDYDYNSK